uniref:Uncharacterized protein n=1 Tax=Lactuca sativa TaxID=4236 RepID=A0A9R1X1E1_LACSA|nr:hypothetical protein LSAT_V11C700343960 [Lactuca sativa]
MGQFTPTYWDKDEWHPLLVFRVSNLMNSLNNHSIANNNACQLIFDKLADIDASKESWNIHPYLTNELSGRSATSLSVEMKAITCLLLRNISSISRKPQQFMYPMRLLIGFPDLLANNFDTRVAFVSHISIPHFFNSCLRIPCESLLRMEDKKRLMNLVTHDLSCFVGQFCIEAKNLHFRTSKRNCSSYHPAMFGQTQILGLHVNDNMPHILEFKKSLNALDKNVESSSHTSHLHPDNVVVDLQDYYLHFQIKNID